MALSITSFVAGTGTINLASSTTLTAVFAGGVGFLLPGNVPIASGVALTVTPPATTTYTLYVTDGTSTLTSSPVTITVTVPAERKMAVTSGGGVIVGKNNYFVDGKQVWTIQCNVNPFCLTDHTAHTNEETIEYDVTVNNAESFQIVGITDLNAFLGEFGLSWA